MNGVNGVLSSSIVKLDNNLLEEIKPFLGGLDISQMNRIANYINCGDFDNYKEHIANSCDRKIIVFYENTEQVIKTYMGG